MPKPKSRYVPLFDDIVLNQNYNGKCAVVTKTHYLSRDCGWCKLEGFGVNCTFFDSAEEAILTLLRS